MPADASVADPTRSRMTTRVLTGPLIALALSVAACGLPSAAPAVSTTSAPAQVAARTGSAAATVTASPEPSPSPTPAPLDLEIVEWFEHAIPNLADPSITDTNVEILVHNPNEFPVSVNTDELEFRLLNTDGEVVYAIGSSYFSLWQGSWMLAGDSTGFQICACFQTSGLETREWDSIELSAPLESATDLVYTMDVDATLGEPMSIFGSGVGIPITMTNTSELPLQSIAMRVIARDAKGRYIGMPAFGSSVASFTEEVSIRPGETAQGILDSEIDYFDEPLTYEVVAIGIPALGAADAQEPVSPPGAPLAEWGGIPIMPGAVSGGETNDGYEFSTQAPIDEIMQFYQAALAELGYSLTTSGEESGVSFLLFQKETAQAIVGILPGDGLNRVQITTTP
jgi:hypothetical protein